jgi:PAS domain S-box-containing protein
LDFLSFTDFPIYFENSKKSHLIISNEVENDPRLIELNEYFNITKTRSLLDASAMIGNKLIAIICFESCTPHNWTPEETYFIRSFSENITTLFLRFEDRNLRKKNELIAKELRQFIETANAPIFGIDDNGLVNEWNQTFETITGFKKVDVLGKDLVQTYITEDFREAVKQVLDNALKGKETANFEFPLFTNEGEHVMVLLNSSTRRNAAGEITGVLGVGQDITELVGHRNNLELKVDQRTLKLKQASQYSRSLIEASLDPLVTISAEGIITDVNEGSIEVTGVAREKLIGTEFSNYFTEPDLALAGYQEAFEKGSVRNYPLTIRHKKGKLTDVLYNASVYRDTDGNILGVFAAARDITAQKQASQYSRSLIEASLDPLVTISAEGIITDVNNASEKVTGATREELIGTDFSNYFTEPEKARAGYKKVFDEGSVSDYPLTIRHKKGKLTDVLYNASVYRDTDGNILGVFAAARDITQLVSSRKKLELRTKELYEALKKEKELNELKSRFVSTASHEFRTPLSAINFAAGSIKKYWSKMEPIMIEEKLDKIENQVLHMTELLDDVLLVGQAEADEIRNHPLTLNLGSFIDEIIEEVYHSSKKAQKIVLVDTESLKSTDIYIDEKLGRNIFTNLISNAVKFSPDADKVIVELSSEKDYTIISVTDFGLGIPESEIEKIFMPFTRGENVDSIQGTGLGLSIVKEALVAMGGKIIVNSTLGKGTTFMAKIPKKQI